MPAKPRPQKSRTFEKYNLLSLLTSSGLLAVFAHDAEDFVVDVFTKEIHAIGIAEMKTILAREGFPDTVKDCSRVAVSLSAGELGLCINEESGNFIGICKTTDDVLELVENWYRPDVQYRLMS